ncbi:NnrS family protein [Aestuariibacter sp. AA17]|uniref:NnrS family protein n=1 Tax=Fluctibacter corallii TaxID=2984329 RepID=A0ABT3A4I9_9ALTE|nr:NnrS family protein [Aestuariibacter sp. AA17]MCV2883586.1 NnrS family protein [Aestuariibacter sp. AA17]
MLQITDLQQEQKIAPLLRLGFRPFFLFGAVLAFTTVLYWAGFLQGHVSWIPSVNPIWWHGHEMLFGFLPAIIAGFLLTAVQNWTGIPGIRAGKLGALFALWVTARVLLFTDLGISMFAIMIIDVGFLLASAAVLAQPVLKIKQYRNLVFVPLLTLMAVANVVSYLPLLGLDAKFQQQGFYGMAMLVTMLVSLLGGRVVPFFTANGTGNSRLPVIMLLEVLSVVSVFTLFLYFISGVSLPPEFIAAVCFVGAIAQSLRWLRWRPFTTGQVPLLWSLHSSYVFIPIGLALMGIALLFPERFVLGHALHALTVGAMGGMILAMMARVSLGHTGRQLGAGGLMQGAFVLVVLAASLRSVGMFFWPQYSDVLLQAASLFWCLSFAAYVYIYWPILSAPRVDGKPG